MAIYIWGDHCYTVSDEQIKRQIVKEEIQGLEEKPPLVASIQRPPNNTPGCSFWKQFTKIQPGHFCHEDLQEARSQLLKQGICPQVKLNGCGEFKSLKYNQMIIHKHHKDSFICMKFLEEYSKFKTHSIVYKGESMASFNCMIFEDLCKVPERPQIPHDKRKQLAWK